MNLKDYIHHLQQKPVRERERIAVIVTIIGFFIFFGIWLISFHEMNKPDETQSVDQTSASLNDLKNNFQAEKESIQDMMRQIPQVTAPMENNRDANTDNIQAPVDNPENGDQENRSVPQLP